jgi:signal transduction histidine kinase
VAPDWQQIDVIIKYRAIQGFLKGVTLTSTLGELSIYADLMFEKVMYNLVENSIRHGLNISRIYLSCHERDGNMVIWYEDDGGGISNAEKEKIFEKGFGKNTGLGLFLIREILSISGITIIETGEFGVGVKFEMVVPKGGYRYLS